MFFYIFTATPAYRDTAAAADSPADSSDCESESSEDEAPPNKQTQSSSQSYNDWVQREMFRQHQQRMWDQQKRQLEQNRQDSDRMWNSILKR